MFYGGKLKSMPAKLLSDDGENVVIRPLAYCAETDIKAYAEEKAFPIIPCTLCGSQDNLQRQAIKQMLIDWDKQKPGRSEKIFNCIQNIVPSHLLDTEVFDFKKLGETHREKSVNSDAWLLGSQD
jgi:tRNA 2-thiocytidine biosynthesis protein TtcA